MENVHSSQAALHLNISSHVFNSSLVWLLLVQTQLIVQMKQMQHSHPSSPNVGTEYLVWNSIMEFMLKYTMTDGAYDNA